MLVYTGERRQCGYGECSQTVFRGALEFCKIQLRGPANTSELTETKYHNDQRCYVHTRYYSNIYTILHDITLYRVKIIIRKLPCKIICILLIEMELETSSLMLLPFNLRSKSNHVFSLQPSFISDTTTHLCLL